MEHPRYDWAMQMLKLAPSDHLLEIGCGTGILAGKIAQRLTCGSITAIDRSAAMIRKAEARNREAISQEKIRLITAEFPGGFIPPSFLYQRVFTFNTTLFLDHSPETFEMVRQCLYPGGYLYIFHQPPYNITRQLGETTQKALKENHFTVREMVFREFQPAPAFCIKALPG